MTAGPEIMESNLEIQVKEKVIAVNRVAKVVKGGKRFSFSAIVVVGDGQGKVGWGLGKAREVPEAIRKAIEHGKKHLLSIPLQGRTLPHEIVGHFGSARVLFRPAAEGTGIIAGGPVRAIMDLSGVANVLTKSIGTNNPHNVVKAAFDALEHLQSPASVSRRKGGEAA